MLYIVCTTDTGIYSWGDIVATYADDQWNECSAHFWELRKSHGPYFFIRDH
jgi:hypothetical protein